MAPLHSAISWLALGLQLLVPVLAQAPNAFDYVIVGGGNAGLTVASRLSEDPTVSVAVIEAGNFYEIVTGNQSQIPANDALYNGKSANDTNPLVDWGFLTTPQAVGNHDPCFSNCLTQNRESMVNVYTMHEERLYVEEKTPTSELICFISVTFTN